MIKKQFCMEKNKILIIEDNLINFSLILEILDSKKIVSVIAKNGQKGIEKAIEIMPDLIILDIGLPDISGFEVCRILKANLNTKNIPIIFLTAFDSKNFIIQGFEAGAVDYVTKPFFNNELLARIDSQLNIVNLQKELVASEQKYKAYIENTPTGILVINDLGQIIGGNPAICKFLKFSIEELKNINIKEILDNDSFVDFDCIIDEINRLSKTSGKLKIKTKLAEEKWISIDAYKSEEKIVIFSQDITVMINNKKLLNSYTERLEAEVAQRTASLSEKIEELKILEKKLKKLLNNEKEINKLKTNIVTTVSHDFRTPLSVIQSSVELIENFNLKLDETKRKNLFNKIYNTIELLINLLNNMLVVNTLENESFIINNTNFDLKQEIKIIIEELELVNNNKFKIKSIFRGNNLIFSDNVLITQILTNLLSNALKYSEKDCIIKTIILEKTIKFYIKDFGIGISDSEKKNIFKIFYRAYNSNNYKGSGVGLYIVSKNVKILKGKIRMKSEIGKGTLFLVEIPINSMF